MVRSSVAVCVLLAAAPSCPDLYSLATHGFKVPTIETANGVAQADLAAGLRLGIGFTANNPNPFPLSVAGVDYEITLQGQPALAGSQESVDVPENGASTLTLSGVLALGSAAFRALRPGANVPYTVTGTAHVKSPAGVMVDVDFAGAGSFAIPSLLPTR